ncbi:hypothetical protein BpHYR1_048629 [Brachionus plicatilis]|uniref:Uncharacterized protein n=1 Tax=Brachionus plicatilis TaxID=10195 RepID=A0A3M7PVS3_BRAPC|nr:hypothetical protein BpHYR1_048629 [Brachionus plicatilis]
MYMLVLNCTTFLGTKITASLKSTLLLPIKIIFYRLELFDLELVLVRAALLDVCRLIPVFRGCISLTGAFGKFISNTLEPFLSFFDSPLYSFISVLSSISSNSGVIVKNKSCSRSSSSSLLIKA